MPEGSVEVTAAVVLLVPGNRVVLDAFTHGKLARVVGFFIHGSEHMNVRIKPRIGSEAVPLVDMFPSQRQCKRSGMSLILNQYYCFLNLRMVGEQNRRHLSVPRPVVAFRVGSCLVNCDGAFMRLLKPLIGRLLL